MKKRLLFFLVGLVSAQAGASVVYGPQAFNYPIGESVTITADANYSLSGSTPVGVIATNANLLSTCAQVSGATSYNTMYSSAVTDTYMDISVTVDLGTADGALIFGKTSTSWSGGLPSTGYLALYTGGQVYIYRYNGGFTQLGLAHTYTPPNIHNFTFEFLLLPNGDMAVRINGTYMTGATDTNYSTGDFGFSARNGTSYFTNAQILGNAIPAVTPGVDPTPAARNANMPVPFKAFNVQATLGYTSVTAMSWASGMVSQGYVSAGWNQIHVDDGWSFYRDENGFIQPLPGWVNMPATIAACKAAGVPHFGLYFDDGTTGCGGGVGSAGYVTYSAAQGNAWGATDINVDDCSGRGGDNQVWEQQLFYNASQLYSGMSYHIWGDFGNSLYTYAQGMHVNSYFVDEVDPATYATFYTQWHQGLTRSLASVPGNLNGGIPMFMELRTGELSDVAGRAQMEAWCLANSPLLAYNVNPLTASAATKATLQNGDFLALDNDLAHPMTYTPIIDDGAGHQIYMKLRSSGAVTAFFSNSQSAGTVMFLPLTYTGIANTLTVTVHDEGAQADIGTTVGSYSVYVSGTGSALLDFVTGQTFDRRRRR